MVSGIKGIDKNGILVLFQADSRDDHICVGMRRRRCDTIMLQQKIMAAFLPSQHLVELRKCLPILLSTTSPSLVEILKHLHS